MKIGTAHFTSVEAAMAYYRKQGITADALHQKIMDGEIHIGEPKLADDEGLEIQDGRYVVAKIAKMIANMKFEFDTTDYEFSHGKKPRGIGSWAFFPNRHMRIEDAVWSPGGLSYADAKKWFTQNQKANAAFHGGIVYVGT